MTATDLDDALQTAPSAYPDLHAETYSASYQTFPTRLKSSSSFYPLCYEQYYSSNFALVFVLAGSKIILNQALMWSLAAISGKTLRSLGFNKPF